MIRSRLLISSERPERIAHGRSFDLSEMSDGRMSEFPALDFSEHTDYRRVIGNIFQGQFLPGTISIPTNYLYNEGIRYCFLYSKLLGCIEPAHIK